VGVTVCVDPNLTPLRTKRHCFQDAAGRALLRPYEGVDYSGLVYKFAPNEIWVSASKPRYEQVETALHELQHTHQFDTPDLGYDSRERDAGSGRVGIRRGTSRPREPSIAEYHHLANARRPPNSQSGFVQRREPFVCAVADSTDRVCRWPQASPDTERLRGTIGTACLRAGRLSSWSGGLADGHARSGTPPSKSRCSDSRRSAVATRNAIRYGADLDQRRDDEKR